MKSRELYDGDIYSFIRIIEGFFAISRYDNGVEEQIRKHQSEKYDVPRNYYAPQIDEGVMRAEYDYNGDLLNYYGYSFY
jgi:hypothetical protein